MPGRDVPDRSLRQPLSVLGSACGLIRHQVWVLALKVRELSGASLVYVSKKCMAANPQRVSFP